MDMYGHMWTCIFTYSTHTSKEYSGLKANKKPCLSCYCAEL